MFKISKEKVDELATYIQEMPYKYASQILIFLEENLQEEEMEETDGINRE